VSIARGDSPETALTNSRVDREHGWPCRLHTGPGQPPGELVWIVEVKKEGSRKLHLDAHGNRYFEGPTGDLVKED
jgi:hypothetical protein